MEKPHAAFSKYNFPDSKKGGDHEKIKKNYSSVP